MTVSRMLVLGAASIALLFSTTSNAPSQTPAVKPGHVNKVYSLIEFEDAEFGKWIASTIPATIMPDSWSCKSGSCGKEATLSYYAPGKVLVVYHTPEAHAQIDAFLKNVKKALPSPAPTAATPIAGIVQAQVPGQPAPAFVPAPAMPAPLPTSYPVPPTATLPKHLFHFIIRYEGEGIIDSNVVKFAQALQEKVTGSSSCPVPSYAPAVPMSAFQPTTLGNTNGAPRMPTAEPAAPIPTGSAPSSAPVNPPIQSSPSPPPPPPFGPTSVR